MTRSEDARNREAELERAVGRKAQRRQLARREGRHTVWFGFGMFGLVGWAVAVPTLAGGRWGSGWTTAFQAVHPGP